MQLNGAPILFGCVLFQETVFYPGIPEENQFRLSSIARMTNAATHATQYPQTQCSIMLPFLRKNGFWAGATEDGPPHLPVGNIFVYAAFPAALNENSAGAMPASF